MFRKELPIPDSIHGYNNNMNGVDLADQGRAEYPTRRRTNLTWKPCFSFMFDTALCNMAKLWDAYGHFPRSKRCGLHFTFRRKLARKLLTKNRARAYTITPGIHPDTRTVLTSVLKRASINTRSPHYGLLMKGSKQSTYKACEAGSHYASKRVTGVRQVLKELSTNIPKPRAPRTHYSCNECQIALCQGVLCWQDHLDAYNHSS